MKLKCIRDCAVVIKNVEKVDGKEVVNTTEVGFRKDEIVSDKSLVDLLKEDKNFVKTTAKSADEGE